MNSYLLHLAPFTVFILDSLAQSHSIQMAEKYSFFLTSKGKLHITFHPKGTRYQGFIISMLMYVCAYVYVCTCPCVCGGQRLVLVVSCFFFFPSSFSLHKPKDYCFRQSELSLPGHAPHHWGYRYRLQSLTFLFYIYGCCESEFMSSYLYSNH